MDVESGWLTLQWVGDGGEITYLHWSISAFVPAGLQPVG